MENKYINDQIKGFLMDEDMIASLANISSVIMNGYENLNWAGFYFVKKGQLIVGPFQGKPACSPIPFSKGVCGKCYRDKETQLINDVLAIKDHIACDSASRSELCVPVIVDEEVIMEIDLDSPIPNRFDEDFANEMKKAAEDISVAYKEHHWSMD